MKDINKVPKKVKNKESVNTDNQIIMEFGGPIGATVLIIWSHSVLLYFWISIKFYDGGFYLPFNIFDIFQKLKHAIPNLAGCLSYFWFIGLQLLFAFILPGPVVKGLPVPTEGNIKHNYKCNAATAWWFTIIIYIFAYKFNFYNPSLLIDNLGPMLVVAMIFSNCVALIIYYLAIVKKKAIRMQGNFIYDFFMGAYLNPKIWSVDLKLFAEIRASWMQLFLFTVSAAIKQYETQGFISKGMVIMLTAHFLYCNSCMKGEECVVSTWDIFYEKFGWMLIFWNLAGVPFLYCFHSFYILQNSDIEMSWVTFLVLILVLFTAYFIWDTSQSQRNRFRQIRNGTFIKRWTFPQLPWGTLTNPKYITTEAGSELLIDGWWKYARKIHYTCDIIMAFVWAFSCSCTGILPFFYPIFFVGMIIHRYRRDVERCKRKYKLDWDKYCSIVPYAFVPYVI